MEGGEQKPVKPSDVPSSKSSGGSGVGDYGWSSNTGGIPKESYTENTNGRSMAGGQDERVHARGEGEDWSGAGVRSSAETNSYYGDHLDKNRNKEAHKSSNGDTNKNKNEDWEDSTNSSVKYNKKQHSREVEDGSHSEHCLDVSSGAISKDRRIVSSYQDEHHLGSRYQGLPDQTNSARRPVNEFPKQMSQTPQEGVEYIWQFQNEHGSWVTYGQVNSSSAFPTVSKVTSDDIEEYFRTDPEMIPLHIQTDYNSYVLNFQTMTQTNGKTEVQRRIRRVPKQQATDTRLLERHGLPQVSGNASGKRNVEYNSNSVANSDRLNNRDNLIPNQEVTPITHEWQFEDDRGYWITFGQTSSGGGHGSPSVTTSDDIERFLASPPGKVIMTVQSHRNTYILNFQTMTQVNTRTQIQRRIRRVPKLGSSKKGFLLTQYHKVVNYVTGNKSSSSEKRDTQYHDTSGNPGTYSKPVAAENVSHNTGEHINRSTRATRPGSAFQVQDFRNTAGASPVHRRSFQGQQLGSPICAGDEAANRESRYGVQEFTHINPVNYEATRLHSDTAARASYGNSLAAVPGSGTFLHVNHLPSAHGTANSSSLPGSDSVQFSSSIRPVTDYVWQFRDEHGVWVPYGKANSVGSVICTTSATSDDIERHYCVHKDKVPMVIVSLYNRYVLDFQTMTQTNDRTLVQRPIRRVLSAIAHE